MSVSIKDFSRPANKIKHIVNQNIIYQLLIKRILFCLSFTKLLRLQIEEAISRNLPAVVLFLVVDLGVHQITKTL